MILSRISRAVASELWARSCAASASGSFGRGPPVDASRHETRRRVGTPSAREWSTSRAWLKVDGETLEVETGILQVCDESDAVTAGASSVLALHCDTSHELWTELAASLRQQQAEAVTAYDAGGSPTAPIWSTPRAICAPIFFGHGKTSSWPRRRTLELDDLVRVLTTSAAAAHASRTVENEGLDPKQYMALLQDLGVSTKRLETHFFEGQTTTSLTEGLVDEKSALGLSMEALGQASGRTASNPAIAASAPPRWRLLGQSMGAAVAVHALTTDKKFGGSLDAVVLIDPQAFTVLSDPRCGDTDMMHTYEVYVTTLASHADAGDWKAWYRTYSNFWCPEEGHEIQGNEVPENLIASALTATHEAIANLEAVTKAKQAQSRDAVDALAALRCPKHVVMSSAATGGAREVLQAVAQLLHKHAGFSVHKAEGGHFAPRTHASTTIPLMARCLLDMVYEDASC